VRRQGLDVFQPSAGPSLSGLRGWAALGLPESGSDKEPRVTVLDALRTLALDNRARTGEIPPAELVATLPMADSTVLATVDVVRPLVDGARRSLLVIGYAIGDDMLRRSLVRRGLEGITVTVVGDRQNRAARELLKDWPRAARPLRALENIEPATPTGASLHAKVIVADETTAMLGSANFTAGGLRYNLELGVRVAGAVPAAIVRTVNRLESEGWLVPPQT
jgi:phosphatidylserine/phosphatidylglycerophosphate/cardiolipin synthase-like enzyme